MDSRVGMALSKLERESDAKDRRHSVDSYQEIVELLVSS